MNNANAPLQKDWANATPAGLVALAVACFCFFALLSGKVQGSATMLIGCWLIGGFVVQLIVGLLDLKSGNMTGGNTFLYFSAFFMLVSGAEMIVKTLCAANNIAFDSTVDGWAWLCLTLVVMLWTPAFFKVPNVLTLIVLCLDFALPFVTLKDMGILEASLYVIPAYGFLAAGVLGIYLSGATIINNTYGKTVLPINLTAQK